MDLLQATVSAQLGLYGLRLERNERELSVNESIEWSTAENILLAESSIENSCNLNEEISQDFAIVYRHLDIIFQSFDRRPENTAAKQ